MSNTAFVVSSSARSRSFSTARASSRDPGLRPREPVPTRGVPASHALGWGPAPLADVRVEQALSAQERTRSPRARLPVVLATIRALYADVSQCSFAGVHGDVRKDPVAALRVVAARGFLTPLRLLRGSLERQPVP